MKLVAVLFAALFEIANAEIACSRSRGYAFVDLTHPFDESTLGYPGQRPFELKLTHCGYTEDGYWLQTEDYSSAVHFGTHMDAPCHAKKGQWTMEDIPLNRFMAPAAVIDISFRTKEDSGANLEVTDLLEWEDRTKASLDGTIVLVSTGWSRKWKDRKSFLGTDTDDVTKLHFPGVSPAAAEWLVRNRNIYGLGIDTTSLDNGQAVHPRANQAFSRANIYGLLNVAELHRLPPYGATVFVFPMRIKRACGAPTRIIALVPEEYNNCGPQ